jgi:hypothetical protein
MTKRVRLSMGLWALFSVVVFNVTFDWQTRMAGLAFAGEQVSRHAAGLPLATINEGFSPLVRSAALRSTAWLGLILGTGLVATVAASRATNK